MHVFIEDSYRLRSCDMATPSPWPAGSVFVKRYWRLPKTDPNSVLIEEVLLDHPSHCLPLGFWPAWKYDPHLLMWDLWIRKHSHIWVLLVQKELKLFKQHTGKPNGANVGSVTKYATVRALLVSIYFQNLKICSANFAKLSTKRSHWHWLNTRALWRNYVIMRIHCNMQEVTWP